MIIINLDAVLYYLPFIAVLSIITGILSGFIARTYLKNPKILLLDEPTSSLDKESELEAQKSLDDLSNDKTTISISHNLSTIEHYDQIYVLDKGRIKEHGTHDELMKLKKRYYTLHKFSSIS